MSVYLDRFLNVPAATVPEGHDATRNPEEILSALSEQLNRQQQVNQVGSLVSYYLSGAGDPTRLQGVLGQLLLREDRDFHTIQAVEGAVRQVRILGATPHGAHVMIAASRYLAAHSPTVRAQGQTYQIAERLHRGEALYADEHSAGGPD